MTNEEEAEVLGVPLHAPAFLFERTSTSERGEVVEFVRSIYRGDRYRLVTELRARAGLALGAGISHGARAVVVSGTRLHVPDVSPPHRRRASDEEEE